MITKAAIICAMFLGTTLVGCALVDPGDLPMTQPLVVLQDVTMLAAFFVVIIEAAWMYQVHRHGQTWRILYGVGTVLVGLHVVVFYGVTLLFRAEILHYPGNAEIVLLTNWSAVVKAQFIGMVLITEGLRLWDILGKPCREPTAGDVLTHGDHP